MRLAFCVLSGLLLVACGGSNNEADYPLPDPPGEPVAQSPAPRGSLWRRDVVHTVDQGLGRFLQKVELEPSLDAGKFRGFRIVELRPEGFWRGVDLAPGDVVMRVNGMPIEREMQAYSAFQSLKTADELRVDYLRGGVRKQLVYRIVEHGKDAR